MDRIDILHLYVVTNLPLPAAALPPTPDPWDIDPNETTVLTSAAASGQRLACAVSVNC